MAGSGTLHPARLTTRDVTPPGGAWYALRCARPPDELELIAICLCFWTPPGPGLLARYDVLNMKNRRELNDVEEALRYCTFAAVT